MNNKIKVRRIKPRVGYSGSTIQQNYAECIGHGMLVWDVDTKTSKFVEIANDYGFEFVFERLVEAELRKGDILVALSTSGKSINVLKAINKALNLGVEVHLWTGSNNPELKGVDVWNCALESTPRIQELHLIWGHLLAEYVELHFE